MKDNFEKFLNQIDKLGGDSRQLVFEKPASFSDILEILQDFVVSSKAKNIRIELNKNNWGELPEVLKTIKL